MKTPTASWPRLRRLRNELDAMQTPAVPTLEDAQAKIDSLRHAAELLRYSAPFTAELLDAVRADLEAMR